MSFIQFGVKCSSDSYSVKIFYKGQHVMAGNFVNFNHYINYFQLYTTNPNVILLVVGHSNVSETFLLQY